VQASSPGLELEMATAIGLNCRRISRRTRDLGKLAERVGFETPATVTE
jgi:hypothetical protein